MATQTPLPTTEHGETPDYDQTIANINSGKIQIFGLPDAFLKDLNQTEIAWLPTLTAAARPENPENVLPYGTDDTDKRNWLRDQKLTSTQASKLEPLYHLLFTKEIALDYLYQKHQDAKDELAVLQHENDKLTQNLDTLYTRVAFFKQETKKLQTDLAVAQAQVGQATIRANTTSVLPATASPVPSRGHVGATPVPGGGRSAKQPDPDKFTGERDKDGKLTQNYRHWQAMIQQKLRINEDHYPDENSRLLYIFNRTGGNAADFLDPYLVNGAVALADTQDLWDVMDSTYIDPDEENKARRAYQSLRQSNKPFHEFHTEFLRLARKASVPESQWYNDLWDKLSSENRQEMRVFKDVIITFEQLVKKARTVDSERQIEATRRRPFQPKTASNTAAPALAVTSSRPAYSTPRFYPRSQTPVTKPTASAPSMSLAPRLEKLTEATRAEARRENRCFKCRKIGHYAADCPEEHVKESKVNAVEETGQRIETPSPSPSEN